MKNTIYGPQGLLAYSKMDHTAFLRQEKRVICRRAKSRSKCLCGKPIGRGEIVVITDLLKVSRRVADHTGSFLVHRPQRFCLKCGTEWLHKIIDGSQETLHQLQELEQEDRLKP